MSSTNNMSDTSITEPTQKLEHEEIHLEGGNPVQGQDSSNPNQATGWKLVTIVLCFVMAISCVAIDNTGMLKLVTVAYPNY